MVTMYAVFTRLRTIEHRYFFECDDKGAGAVEAHSTAHISDPYHAVMPFLLIAAIGVLVELLSVFLNEGIAQTNLPLALTGVLMALISASPEILTAIKATLGASLATVLMTIPAVEIFALLTQTNLILA